jgi:hypothetical protein
VGGEQAVQRFALALAKQGRTVTKLRSPAAVGPAAV